MTVRRYTNADMPSGLDLRRSFAFNRRPGARNNRGRVSLQVASQAIQDPSQIFASNTYQWLEGLTGATIASGVISAYPDRSPSAFNYTSSGGSQPAAETGGWDGLDSVYFDGSNDVLNNADTGTGAFAVAMASGNDKAWAMWFAVQTIATGDQGLWGMGNTGSTTNYLEMYQANINTCFKVRKNGGSLVEAFSGASNQNRHVFKLICNGTDVRIYRDGVLDTVTNAPNLDTASVTLNRDTIGCLGRNVLLAFGKFRMAARVTVAGTPTAGQIAAMDAYMAKFYQANTAPMLIVAGDSMSIAATWPSQLAIAGGSATIVDVAVVGETLAGTGGLARQLQTVTSNYSSTRTANAVANLYGTNDFALLHRTAAQLKADFQTWISNEKAAHPTRKIIIPTISRRGGTTPIAGADETERVTFNTDVRANYLTWGADYLCDKDGMFPEDPDVDTTLYVDGIHHTTLGYQYMCTGRNGYTGLNAQLTAIGF